MAQYLAWQGIQYEYIWCRPYLLLLPIDAVQHEISMFLGIKECMSNIKHDLFEPSKE